MDHAKAAATARFSATANAAIACYDGAGGAALTAGISGFVPGTLIQTEAGSRQVEALKPGSMVLAESGELCRVAGILTQRLTAEAMRRTPANALVWIRAGTFGRDKPRRDLVVAAAQRLRCGRAMLTAASLVNGGSIRRITPDQTTTLVRVLLAPPASGTILAEGLCCDAGRPGFPRPVDNAELVRTRLMLDAQDGISHNAPVGNIETIDRQHVIGWAHDPDRPDARVCIEVTAEGRTRALVLADQLRPDLAMAGIGDGQCAFAARLRPKLSPLEDQLVHVRRAGGADIGATPVLIPRARYGAADLARALDDPTGAPDATALAVHIDRLLQARAER